MPLLQRTQAINATFNADTESHNAAVRNRQHREHTRSQIAAVRTRVREDFQKLEEEREEEYNNLVSIKDKLNFKSKFRSQTNRCLFLVGIPN